MYLVLPANILFNTKISEKALKLYLFMSIDWNQGEKFTRTNKAIEKALGFSVRSIARYLRELKESNLINVLVIRDEYNQVISREITTRGVR